MATELAKAYVQIVPSADGLSSGIQSALGDGEGIGKQYGAKLGSGISTAFKAGGVALAAVGTAAAGLGKSLLDSAKQTSEAGDKIEKMSQKVGMSAKAYQEWDYVLKISGTEMSSMTTGLKTLTNKLDDAKNGSEGAKEMFSKLGLSMEDLSTMSREEVFAATIEGFQGMADSTERAALANDLFGKSGQDLTPLFNTSAEATRELINEVNEYGGVMSDDAVKASAAFKDSLTKLNTTFEGLKNSVVSNLLPSLTDVTDGISDLFAGKEGAEEKIRKGVDGIVNNLTKSLPQFTKIVLTVADAVLKVAPEIIKSLAKGILDNMPQLLKTALEVIMELATGLIDALPELIPATIDIMLQIVDGLLDNIDKIIEGGVKLIVGLIEGLTKAIPKIIEAMPQIIKAIWNAITQTNWLDLGKQIVMGIINGLKSAGAAIWEAAGELKDSIMNAVKSKFQIHSPSKLMSDEVGTNLARGISEGFIDEADNVNKAMADAIETEFNVSASTSLGASLAQNATTSGSVSTTDNLLLQMLNKLDSIANQQIVLDSGVLVGATAPAMNTALGRLAVREGAR